MRLAATAMNILNNAQYDENSGSFAALQLYKTYGRQTVLYGVWRNKNEKKLYAYY